MIDPGLAVLAVVVFAVSETDPALPMPLPMILGIFTLVGGIVTAVVTAISKKWRTPADDREDRRFGVEADERLLQRFENMLKERDTKFTELEQKFEDLKSKVEGYQRERTVLIDFIYAVVRIVRDLGAINEIPRPPQGIFISGHPSNDRQDSDA
jgi:Txe/YoeB family toxin of Txe-Axe toxin-antitoxin module